MKPEQEGKPEKERNQKYCGVRGCSGHYKYGSGLYDYYSCGHAYEKPFTGEYGRWIKFKSPYEKGN